MTELLGLPYSPWTEKARWALDARRVPYTFRHYQPLLGEPALRIKLRRPTARISVPVLTTSDGRAIADSADIARWADERGEGPRLFPAEHGAAIARFIALSERALAAGRALSLARMLADGSGMRIDGTRSDRIRDEELERPAPTRPEPRRAELLARHTNTPSTPQHDAFYAGLRQSAQVGGGAAGASTSNAARRLDAIRDGYAGPYQVDGQRIAAPAMFRMNGGANQASMERHAKELDAIAAVDGVD